MALPCWMRVILSVIYEVAAFLIHEPHATRDSPRTPCAFDGFSHTQPAEPLGLSDYLLTSLSNALGLELPRAVTILNGLPLATSLLLRLTEVIPSELILFFCITGMIFWLTCAFVCCVVIVCASGLLFRVLYWPPRAAVNWLTARVGTPPPVVRPPRVNAPPQRPQLPATRQAALSDEVRHFAPDVLAHNPTPNAPNSNRRSTRRNTGP